VNSKRPGWLLAPSPRCLKIALLPIWFTSTLWIVDESSLLATRHVNGLLHQARERGVERIIFVGDERQHHAIEAGRPILQLQHAGMPTARLQTIRRQRDPEPRKAVALAAAEKMAEAAALLGEQQRIVAIATRRNVIGRSRTNMLEATKPATAHWW